MGNGIHISSKSKVRRHQQKTEEVIAVESGRYLHDFIIALTFSTGETKSVDFLPLFHKYVKGDNLKYFALQQFKKFIVKNGNIYWGRNEDVIFPVHTLSRQEDTGKSEKILYII